VVSDFLSFPVPAFNGRLLYFVQRTGGDRTCHSYMKNAVIFFGFEIWCDIIPKRKLFLRLSNDKGFRQSALVIMLPPSLQLSLTRLDFS
jgi:hypothetical protein